MREILYQLWIIDQSKSPRAEGDADNDVGDNHRLPCVQRGGGEQRRARKDQKNRKFNGGLHGPRTPCFERLAKKFPAIINYLVCKNYRGWYDSDTGNGAARA
ncbi:MAG: hypothetical protein ACREMA_12510 [Longimicrobiales bacterium]